MEDILHSILRVNILPATAQLVFLHLQHIQPVHHHHRFHQITLQIHMHPIEGITLDTHVPRTEMLHASSTCLDLDRLFEQHQRFVALRDHPFVRLVLPRRVRSHEEPRPEGIWRGKIREGGRGEGVDVIEPVQSGLQVEIVPQSVPENEGKGFGGLAGAKKGFEAVGFFSWDGEADHCLDLPG